MSDLVKVKGLTGFARDPKTGAIINVDENAYQTALKRKKAFQEAKKDSEEKDNRIKVLENELAEIKRLILAQNQTIDND